MVSLTEDHLRGPKNYRKNKGERKGKNRDLEDEWDSDLKDFEDKYDVFYEDY